MSETTELHLTSPAFKANPFPAFALVRADDPVHQINLSDGQRAWLITRYQDADIVLRDERFVKERLKHGLLSGEQPHLPGPVGKLMNQILLNVDPPDQMALLKQNPALIKTAIEEFLRYRGSLMLATPRWADVDVLLGRKLIHCGDQVLVALAAANRDGEAFANPDTLDITRQENRHLAFGKGIHYCLGAPLARLEGLIALGTLLRCLPHLRLESDRESLIWRPGSMILGLHHLPVVF